MRGTDSMRGARKERSKTAPLPGGRLGEASLPGWRLVLGAVIIMATARAEIAVPVATEVGSGVTIKVTSPVASVPRFGFMPVRVTVENNSPADGTWRFRFEAGSARQFPGLGSTTFELEVPAARNREAWFFVPMAEPGVSINPAAMTTGSLSPAALPSTPPPIAGIYPDPKTPGVSYQVNSSVSSSAAGLTRTFTITQIGPASALPPVPQVLPNGASVSSTTRASDGLVTRTTVVPVTVGRTGAPSITTSGGYSFSAASNTATTSGTAMMNARNALARAGLNPSGTQLSTSTRIDTSKPGAQVFVVTLRQSGPANLLPPVDPKALPAGFTAVNVTPDADGSNAVREFTYVEQVATSRGTTWSATPFNAPSVGVVRKAPSDLQAEARRVLGPTRLLEAQPGVKTTVGTQFISLTSAGSPTPANLIGNSMVIFEQTGPASILSQGPNTLPSGVRVTRLPGGASGALMRIVSYVDPEVLNGIMAHANSMAANPNQAATAATNLGRVELLRRGFLRTLPTVSVAPVPTTRNSVAGTPGPPDLVIFTENGPAALLPQPPADALPAGITCTVTQGAIPGEVARNFVINVPAFLTGQAAASVAPVAGGTPGAPRRTVRVTSGTMLNPPMLFVEVSGPRVARLTSRAPFANNVGSTAMPPLATTAALDSALRGKLSAAGIRVPPNIAALDPAQLPADWRVWSSFSAVLLKADEHGLLDPARRAALRSWVAMGGLLWLVPEAAGEAQSERVGAGRIETLAEPIAEIGPADVVGKLQLTQLAPGLPEREQMLFQPGTRLGDTVTFEAPDMLWVSLLLVAFALLVGPGNVYFFAPAKKRHRLFLTTPLLSLCGAAAMGAAILLQDGLGGEGRRRALVVFVPGESQAAVFQEQGARSGFLTKREFALGDGVICAALPVEGNLFMMSAGATTLVRQGGEAGGDWFRNRSRQAHLLRTLAPTRARIELVGRSADGAPQVESTVATELREFRLRDEDGRIWTAEKVPVGRRTTLRATEKSERAATEGNDGTPHLLALVREASTLTEPWQWVAKGGGIEIAPIATLRSIRWEDEPVTYAGVVERAGLASGAKEKRGE